MAATSAEPVGAALAAGTLPFQLWMFLKCCHSFPRVLFKYSEEKEDSIWF